LIVEAPWRVNEDDPHKDGELPDAVKITGEDVVLEKAKA
jgi:hypothetical protein